MKSSRVGQGDQVNVNLEVNGDIICTIIFGKESGHPFSGIWQGVGSSTEMSSAAVFGGCMLLCANILSDENYAAVMEFLSQLLLEELERESANLKEGADSDIRDHPF